MKTKMYPHLIDLHMTKKIMQVSMKFPNIPGGFATVFSFKRITEDVRFKVTCKDFYECLTINDSEKMKMDVRNFLEMKQSNFIGLCSNCMNDNTSNFYLRVCGTEGCLYKTCSRKSYHHMIDNIYHYSHCDEARKSLEETK